MSSPEVEILVHPCEKLKKKKCDGLWTPKCYCKKTLKNIFTEKQQKIDSYLSPFKKPQSPKRPQSPKKAQTLKRPQSPGESPEKPEKSLRPGYTRVNNFSIQMQNNLFCGAHALNNLFQNCRKRKHFKNLHFTFENEEIKSTAERINLNNVCIKNQKKALKQYGFLNNDKSIDYERLNTDYPDWKHDLGCDQRHGNYSEDVIFKALKLAGFQHQQIWPSKDVDTKIVSKKEFEKILKTQKVPYGYLINTTRPDIKHWICAVFKHDKLVIIDSRHPLNHNFGDYVKDFVLEKRFKAIYAVTPLE